MSDTIIPNVVIGMPSQLFTLARSFKAASNGKIYIGKIDTDPTITSNQIQVYIQNEDGSTVPVAQPILINAGGYPVYLGQVSKFVTVEGHSMAIYDAYMIQQFYFPNVLKYDPDQFKALIESPSGSTYVGNGQTNVYTSIPSNPKYFGAKGDNATDDTSAFNAAADAVGSNGLNFVPAGTYRLTTPMALRQTAKYYGDGILRFDNAEWWRRGGSSGSVSVNERYTLFYDYNSKSDVTLIYNDTSVPFTWIDDRTIEAAGTEATVSVKINIVNGFIKLGPVAEYIRSYNIFGNGGGGGKLNPQLPNPTTSPTGYDNTSFGSRAMMDMVSGVNNTGLGSKSLMSNKAGINNTATGFLSLYRSLGDGNSAFGSVAGEWLTTGRYNAFFGAGSADKMQTGSFNCAFGADSMGEAFNNQYCIAIGYRANTNTGGASQSNSVYVGSFSGDFNLGSNNTMIGYRAGNCIDAATNPGIGTGHDNVGVGMFAMRRNIAGKESVVVGAGAAGNATTVERSVVIGFESANIVESLGAFTVAIGHSSLQNATGDNNVGVGQQTLKATTTGTGNVAVGSGALVTNTTGINNTAIGNNSGRLTQSGSSTVGLNNTVTVGNDARVSGDNQIQLGNSTTTTYVYGTVQNRSDKRDKAEVKNTDLGIDFILGLRAVDGKWDLRENYVEPIEETRTIKVPVDKTVNGELVTVMEDRQETFVSGSIQRKPDGTHKGSRFHHWFIAQEVQELCESLGVEFGGLQHHAVNGGEDVYSLGYDEFIPPITKAVQECWSRLDEMEQRLLALEEKGNGQ